MAVADVFVDGLDFFFFPLNSVLFCRFFFAPSSQFNFPFRRSRMKHEWNSPEQAYVARNKSESKLKQKVKLELRGVLAILLTFYFIVSTDI